MGTYVRYKDGVSAYIREKARQLRAEKKLTIDELAERFAISRTTIYYWVKDVPELCAFWGALLDVEPTEIKFQRKSNSGRLAGKTWRSKYGVLQVRASDTYLRARIDAWMDHIRADWA
jgi:DNA-binding XRE family transcriptional regulator